MPSGTLSLEFRETSRGVDDERVVREAIGESREAFDELVRRHRGQIYTLIRT